MRSLRRSSCAPSEWRRAMLKFSSWRSSKLARSYEMRFGKHLSTFSVSAPWPLSPTPSPLRRALVHGRRSWCTLASSVHVSSPSSMASLSSPPSKVRAARRSPHTPSSELGSFPAPHCSALFWCRNRPSHPHRPPRGPPPQSYSGGGGGVCAWRRCHARRGEAPPRFGGFGGRESPSGNAPCPRPRARCSAPRPRRGSPWTLSPACPITSSTPGWRLRWRHWKAGPRPSSGIGSVGGTASALRGCGASAAHPLSLR